MFAAAGHRRAKWTDAAACECGEETAGPNEGRELGSTKPRSFAKR